MPHPDYIARLQEAIRAVHGCGSRHVSTAPVTEYFEGKLAWTGEVETFDLDGHPKAKRCYAWGYDDNGKLKSTAVLELPPVDSPSSAVTVAIAAKAKAKQKPCN
jgi:hypothetical protein